MKKLYELSELACLPPEALGEMKLSVAGHMLLIENHRGLREYGSERICVGGKRGRVIISGSSLQLMGMNKKELLLSGSFNMLEWEE